MREERPGLKKKMSRVSHFCSLRLPRRFSTFLIPRLTQKKGHDDGVIRTRALSNTRMNVLRTP